MGVLLAAYGLILSAHTFYAPMFLAAAALLFASLAFFKSSYAQVKKSEIEEILENLTLLNGKVKALEKTLNGLGNTAKMYITLGVELERVKRKLNYFLIVFFATVAAILLLLLFLLKTVEIT